MRLSLAAMALVAALPASAQAALLSYFHFNGGPAGGMRITAAHLADSVGRGTIDISEFTPANVVAFEGTRTNAVGTTPSGAELAIQSGVAGVNSGKSLYFSIPKDGYSQLTMSYATHRTGAGFITQQVDVAGDDLQFVPAATITPSSQLAAVESIDFSTFAFVDAATELHVRITFAIPATGTQTTSNNRIDNVQFNAAVPEPAGAVAIGIAAVSAVSRRTRGRQN